MENMENITAAAEMDDDLELVLKLKKPYQFDGREYTEVDLHGLEDATGADINAVNKILTKMGVVSPTPEMTSDFAQLMAARGGHLPAREVMKLKNIVTGFLYGGDGED